MNTAEHDEVTFVQAVEIIRAAIKDNIADLRDLYDDPTAAPEVIRTNDGWRIYTRRSRNPLLNANGGDYDYWTFVGVTDGRLEIVENWSADWDYADFGGATYIGPLAGENGVAALINVLREQVKNAKKGNATHKNHLRELLANIEADIAAAEREGNVEEAKRLLLAAINITVALILS